MTAFERTNNGNELGATDNFFSNLSNAIESAQKYFSEQIAINLNNAENSAIAMRFRYIFDQFAKIPFAEDSLKSGHLSPSESQHFFSELNFLKTAPEDIARERSSRIHDESFVAMADKYKEFAERIEQIAEKEAKYQAEMGDVS